MTHHRAFAALLGVAIAVFAGSAGATSSKHTGTLKHVATPPAAAALEAPQTKAAAPNREETQNPAPAKTSSPTAAEVKRPEVQEVKAPLTWSPTEIADAKARCAVILKKINAVAIPEPSIKEGACGAPAPVQLVSIGTKPQVSISPPAILTCEMAEALSTWVEGDLQTLAKTYLGAEIINIETMSSYSCRNAYGRVNGKLSEHGLANALDIRGFVTASAKTAYVLEDWGTPQREILARIAAQKAAAEKAALAQATAEKAAQTNQVAAKTAGPQSGTAKVPPASTASTAGAPAAGIARTTIADGIAKLTVTIPGAKTDGKTASSLGIAEPDHLGGPKEDDVAKHPKKTEFLHAAHEAACRIFGTTLGPEANGEHRNHFHVDMAQRKVTKICD